MSAEQLAPHEGPSPADELMGAASKLGGLATVFEALGRRSGRRLDPHRVELARAAMELREIRDRAAMIVESLDLEEELNGAPREPLSSLEEAELGDEPEAQP